jgi:hypothetical protein
MNAVDNLYVGPIQQGAPRTLHQSAHMAIGLMPSYILRLFNVG